MLLEVAPECLVEVLDFGEAPSKVHVILEREGIWVAENKVLEPVPYLSVLDLLGSKGQAPVEHVTYSQALQPLLQDLGHQGLDP